MDDGTSHQTQRQRRRSREQRHRKRQGWGFTFLGGTPEKVGEVENRATFASASTQNALSMQPVFPLSAAQVGDRVVISQILSGDRMICRLSQMGVHLGSEVEVISKTASGSVIICSQDYQIGLGAGMAKTVMVTSHHEKP